MDKRSMGRSLTSGKVFLIVLILAVACLTESCKRNDAGTGNDGRMKVVASLFPTYDFARQVGRDRVDVTLLLPPGVEAHGFEPKPGDMMRLSRADMLIYTNRHMEPWIQKILQGTQNGRLAVVEAGRGIAMSGESGMKGGRKDADGGGDPHVWLDFSNAAAMVDNIRDGFIGRDPENSHLYIRNAREYKDRLQELDRRYREALSGCQKKILVHGGHAAFGYLAGRYRLRYLSAYGLSPNAEPRPEDMVGLSRALRANGLRHIFSEELLSPRIAETIAKETGAAVLPLYTGANIGKEALDGQETFISLMMKNLERLKEGLQCP
jgi:zinc transport system substrate-binding protein